MPGVHDINETVNSIRIYIPFILVDFSITANCELITATKSKIVLAVPDSQS